MFRIILLSVFGVNMVFANGGEGGSGFKNQLSLRIGAVSLRYLTPEGLMNIVNLRETQKYTLCLEPHFSSPFRGHLSLLQVIITVRVFPGSGLSRIHGLFSYVDHYCASMKCFCSFNPAVLMFLGLLIAETAPVAQ